MAGTPVRVRFRCEVPGCECDVLIDARVYTRESSRLYEYSCGAGECPRCAHRLFARHRAVGEVWPNEPPRSSEVPETKKAPGFPGASSSIRH